MRYKLLIIIASVFFFLCSAFAQFGGPAPKEATKDGWWIKADTQNPASQMMGFYVGANSHSYGFWRVWNPGNPPEFDISEEFRNSPTLYILAQTTSGQKCGFCLMFKSKCVKHIVFDLEQDHEAKQTDEDKTCK